MKGIKKKLDDGKGLWDELLHETLWSYHTIPHITTNETPFAMVYGENIMLSIEIDTTSWQRSQFNLDVNNTRLKCALYLVDELRDVTHIQQLSSKHIAVGRYNSKVVPCEIRESDLVLRMVVSPAQQGKLQPEREGPYKIFHKLPHGANKL